MVKKKRGVTGEDKLYAFLATFLTVVGLIIILITNKKNNYTTFYARQGIVLFVFWIIAMALGWIPFFGWAIWLLFLIVWIMAWINALSGKKKDTWLIGEFAKKIKL